jgi:hypothetical protein
MAASKSAGGRKKPSSGKRGVQRVAQPTSPRAAGAPIGADRMRKQQQAAQRTHVARAASQGRKNQVRRDKRG